jgi:putative Mg2+ transporter-C (MgtC) family protein
MPVAIGWSDIALRLTLAVLGGTLLGINRTERGMVAGLRTTLLVCVAAAVAMIQANLLLDMTGKAHDSFVVLDLMRLPLGILTGMGFIGAGAILRHGGKVTGVTTAAMLWLATVLGLCFGGGQNGLGLAALGIGVVILWCLKSLEMWMRQERRANFTLALVGGGPADEEIRSELESAGYRIASWDAPYSLRGEARRRRIRCELHWRGHTGDFQPPAFIHRLAERQDLLSLRWKA